MAWIKVIPLEQATGFLKSQLLAAVKRAGWVWNITGVMSLNPRVMKTSADFYGAVMYGQSPLSRGQREMLGVVVSATNHCVY